MGYARYTITRNGQQIEAGYMVEAECEQPDCAAITHRGIEQFCGETPGGDEYGCGRYFCDRHLVLPSDENRTGWRCVACDPA